MVVLGVVASLEAWDGVRRWWAARRGSPESAGTSFQVRERGRLRKDHYRRHEPGYHPLRSRGLGDPPIRKAGEWSPAERPLERRPGAEEPER